MFTQIFQGNSSDRCCKKCLSRQRSLCQKALPRQQLQAFVYNLCRHGASSRCRAHTEYVRRIPISASAEIAG